jgi:hypothetical protein
MKSLLSIVVLAGVVTLALSTTQVSAQTEPGALGPIDDATGIEPMAAGESFVHDACDSCDYCDSGVYVRRFGSGRLRGAATGARHSLSSMAASGQPLIDPWMRADWTAAQRAAMSSWHAGYYHTEWGAPLALMVPPTVRSQTRWSWGVAQSSVQPLYHQFERPYPGPPIGAMYGDASGSLRPTPRWPSHTDQFGVYYIRGPW